jgi:hypothetical protein
MWRNKHVQTEDGESISWKPVTWKIKTCKDNIETDVREFGCEDVKCVGTC